MKRRDSQFQRSVGWGDWIFLKRAVAKSSFLANGCEASPAWLRVGAFILLLAIIACGSNCSGSSAPAPAAPTPSGGSPARPVPTMISVTINGPTTLIVGLTSQLSATANFADGSSQTVTSQAAWTSNTFVASVSSSGLITGINVGEVDVTATYQSVTGRLHVTVSQPPSSCAYTLSIGTTIDGYPNGGSFPVSVATSPNCQWTANSSTPWIHVPLAATGVGTGTFVFTVDQNLGTARTGTLTIAGKTVTFNQTSGSTPTPTQAAVTFFLNSTNCGGRGDFIVDVWIDGRSFGSLEYNVPRLSSASITVPIGPHTLQATSGVGISYGPTVVNVPASGVAITLSCNSSGSTLITVNASGLPRSIPDVGQITSSLSFTVVGTILDARVFFQFTHSCERNLRMTLRHPDGTAIVVMDRGLERCSGISTTFTSDNPNLGQFFRGKPSIGTWTLEVIDDQVGFVGTLDAWSLTLTVSQ